MADENVLLNEVVESLVATKIELKNRLSQFDKIILELVKDASDETLARLQIKRPVEEPTVDVKNIDNDMSMGKKLQSVKA